LNQKKGDQKKQERELAVCETELKRVVSDLDKRVAKVDGSLLFHHLVELCI